jgi:hypothetical protein
MQVSFQAQGHKLLRATHGKSIEITAEPDISTRATCVIGVAAALPVDRLRELRGRVQVTLTIDDAAVDIIGQVNPSYDSGSRFVIRRSGTDDAHTFLIDADTTADELPRGLVQALRSADARLAVDIAEMQPPPPLVVLRPDQGPHWRRAGRLPADIRTLTLRADRVDDIVDAPVAVQLRKRGARWLVEGYAGVDATLTALLLSAGVETAPLLFAGDLPTKRRERDQLLRAAAASPYTVVLRIPDSHAKGDEIAEILGPQRRVLVGDGIVDHGWRAEALDASALDAHALARPPHLMVIPGTGSDPRAVIDGYVFAERLLDAGLSHRSVDELLEELGFGPKLLYRQ